jgi:hypothetical protein
VKKSVLAHQYDYPHLGGSRLASKIVRSPMLGAVRRKVAFDLEALLRPWVPDGSLLDVG